LYKGNCKVTFSGVSVSKILGSLVARYMGRHVNCVVYVAGNQFKCEFVWQESWDLFENQPTKPIMNIVPDADDAFCGFVDDVRVFQY